MARDNVKQDVNKKMSHIAAEVDLTATVDSGWFVPQIIPKQEIFCNKTSPVYCFYN